MRSLIYKYPITKVGTSVIDAPADGRIISAGIDGAGQICVWVSFPTSGVADCRKQIFLIGTGMSFDDEDKEFIGTVVTEEGLVWHLYEIIDSGLPQ